MYRYHQSHSLTSLSLHQYYPRSHRSASCCRSYPHCRRTDRMRTCSCCCHRYRCLPSRRSSIRNRSCRSCRTIDSMLDQSYMWMAYAVSLRRSCSWSDGQTLRKSRCHQTTQVNMGIWELAFAQLRGVLRLAYAVGVATSLGRLHGVSIDESKLTAEHQAARKSKLDLVGLRSCLSSP